MSSSNSFNCCWSEEAEEAEEQRLINREIERELRKQQQNSERELKLLFLGG